MKVYEAIAQALVAEGATEMFGLMGDGNMSLWGALGRDPRVTLTSARHEAASLAMADGYSRTTGKVGVAMVTCGPGLTQVGTSLVVAARNRSQVVLIIGETPTTQRFHVQMLDQRRWVEANEAIFQTVTSIDNMAEEIAEAFYAARVQRRPVVLNLPMDLQEKNFDWDFEYRPSFEYLPPLLDEPNPTGLAKVADALAAAERPVIIAGKGARFAGAKSAILELAERTGALLATSLQGKGFFVGEEFDVGISGAFAAHATEALLSEADFVLGVGAEVGFYTSEGGLMFPSAQIARIDIKPAPESIGVLPGLHIQGDALKAVAALNALLAQRNVQNAGFRTAETRALLNAPPHQYDRPNDGLDPRRLAIALGKAIPPGAIVTCGVGHFFSFPAMYTALPDGTEMQFSYQFGAVGQTLPVAIGIAVGNPGRPLILIEGDGSLMMNMQELDTINRYKLPIVLLVWNDGGFGAEVHKLKAKGFEPSLAQWGSPDFVAIAKGFGGDGIRLQREEDLPDAVAAGLKAGGLYVIDARVSPSTMSDPYSKVHFGLPNRAPLLRNKA
ncbi:MAG: thiamine pyrophosphate-binding protein [Acetobacteraceae bacterium]|nr:thiamine pyrophosphate-binding protein [Acetobacteraceae bacterium]MSP30637.1 thiamine pyrophosphate-binding protein [Acetobacteraceae bacterium]